ncbi:MAG: dihydroorotate dehydrogenase [Syntrophobacteraceae bacterium]
MGKNSGTANGAPNLAVQLGPLRLKNPVMSASGTFGYGREYSSFLDLRGLGAVVVKGISLKPRAGNPPPRIVETAGGMMNAIGLENVGVEKFLALKLPFLRELGVPVIVNIFGNTLEEYRELAGRLDSAGGLAAIEINVSCPNVKKGGMVFGTDPKMTEAVVRAVKSVTTLPVITKLTPNVTSISELAKAAEGGGSDIISCINTLAAMAVDIFSRRPRLANVVGGLSGPAVKPVAIRCVYEVTRAVKCPVIGIGGITCATDALEFLLAGARAVQVGTANFTNPAVMEDIIEGIGRFLEVEEIEDINSFIGSLDTSCLFPFSEDSCAIIKADMA